MLFRAEREVGGLRAVLDRRAVRCGGAVLAVGGAGQGDCGGGVGGGGQSAAVEAAGDRSVAAPDVGQSALPAGVVDRGEVDACGGSDVVAVAGSNGGCFGVDLGLVEHFP